MKKIRIFSYIITAVIIFGSCAEKGPTGELTGVGSGKDWYEPDPYGMVFIPQGSYNMGPNDQDVPFAHTAQSKTVSALTSFTLPLWFLRRCSAASRQHPNCCGCCVRLCRASLLSLLPVVVPCNQRHRCEQLQVILAKSSIIVNPVRAQCGGAGGSGEGLPSP